MADNQPGSHEEHDGTRFANWLLVMAIAIECEFSLRFFFFGSYGLPQQFCFMFRDGAATASNS
jgi:hypothetical protein